MNERIMSVLADAYDGKKVLVWADTERDAAHAFRVVLGFLEDNGLKHESRHGVENKSIRFGCGSVAFSSMPWRCRGVEIEHSAYWLTDMEPPMPKGTPWSKREAELFAKWRAERQAKERRAIGS